MAKVKMFGTGNFVIGTILYAFRDGESIEARDESHIPLLKAEAKRRKGVFEKQQAIDKKLREKLK